MLQYFAKDIHGNTEGYDYHIVAEMVVNDYKVVVMTAPYFGDQWFTGPINKAQCANTEFDDYDFVIVVGSEKNLLNSPLFLHEVGHLYMDGNRLLTMACSTINCNGMTVANDVNMEKRADKFAARFCGCKAVAAALQTYAAKMLPLVDSDIRAIAEKALEERYAALA